MNKLRIPFTCFVIILLSVYCSAQDWSLSGNSGTSNSKLGSTDNSDLKFYSNDVNSMTLKADGRLRLGINGTNNSRLHIHSETTELAEPGGPPLNSNGETLSHIKITNLESGSGWNDGMKLGLFSNRAFLNADDLTKLSISNGNVRLIFHKSENALSMFSDNAAYNCRLFLNAAYDNGLTIKNNFSSGFGLQIITNTDASKSITVGTAASNRVFSVMGDGRVSIGHDEPESGYDLDVSGKIRACEVKVEDPGWCDYVFEENYSLMSLSEVEEFIASNRHLPEIPSSAEVEENGIELAEMNALLLKKIEELTLHLIRMEKEIEVLKKSE